MFQHRQECLTVPHRVVYETLRRNPSVFPRMRAEPAAPNAPRVLSQVVDKEKVTVRRIHKHHWHMARGG